MGSIGSIHGEIKDIIPSRKVIRYCKKHIPPFGTKYFTTYHKEKLYFFKNNI